jgi:hypothetical protein
VNRTVAVYVEVGRRRVFAGALEWPGWCRSGRDEDSALEALAVYGPRYRRAVGTAARGLTPPKTVAGLEVVERLEGNATTDFGAPGIPPTRDGEPVDDPELKRLVRLLRASWAVFDGAAEAAIGAVLRKGPRGGGRDLDAIITHVMEADGAYLRELGATYRDEAETTERALVDGLREAIVETLSARARGEPPARRRRSSRPPWTPRYAVRRSAWHALDHAWEVEDRAKPE